MRRTRQCCTFQNRRGIKKYFGNRFDTQLRNTRPWLFLTLNLVGTTISVLIPSMNAMVRSSFQVVDGQFVGMENFTRVFHSQAFRLAVKDTSHFILVCIPVLMVFLLWTKVPVAAAADSRNLHRATLLLPMAIPVVSVTLLWKLLLCPQGLLDQLVVWADKRDCFLYTFPSPRDSIPLKR